MVIIISRYISIATCGGYAPSRGSPYPAPRRSSRRLALITASRTAVSRPCTFAGAPNNRRRGGLKGNADDRGTSQVLYDKAADGDVPGRGFGSVHFQRIDR